MRPGHGLQVALFDGERSKRLRGDELPYVAIEAATVAQPHLQPIQAALPASDAGIGAEPVFEKQ